MTFSLFVLTVYVMLCETTLGILSELEHTVSMACLPGGGALECNLTGRCPFFKSLPNPFRKKICILIPCFGIFRLLNNRKTIWKTIAYCS